MDGVALGAGLGYGLNATIIGSVAQGYGQVIHKGAGVTLTDIAGVDKLINALKREGVWNDCLLLATAKDGQNAGIGSIVYSVRGRQYINAEAEGATYTDVWSGGVDGWLGANATLTAPHDAVSDGTTSKNACLKVVCSATVGSHSPYRFSLLTTGTVYDLDFWVYVPTANAKINGFAIYDGGAYIDGWGIGGAGKETAGSWVHVQVNNWKAQNTGIQVFMSRNGVVSSLNSPGDIMYLSTMKITEQTGEAQNSPSDGHGTLVNGPTWAGAGIQCSGSGSSHIILPLDDYSIAHNPGLTLLVKIAAANPTLQGAAFLSLFKEGENASAGSNGFMAYSGSQQNTITIKRLVGTDQLSLDNQARGINDGATGGMAFRFDDGTFTYRVGGSNITDTYDDKNAFSPTGLALNSRYDGSSHGNFEDHLFASLALFKTALTNAQIDTIGGLLP